MYALIQNDQIVKTTSNAKSFFPNTSFPGGRPSPQFLAENNVYEVFQGEQKDRRFYWVTPANPPVQLINGLPRFVYVNTPKQLEDVTEVPEGGQEEVTTIGLKTEWIAAIKKAANLQLAQTDWYILRKSERGIDVPQNIIDERSQIISDTSAKEAAIQACTTVDELKDLLFPAPPPEEFDVS